MSAHYICTASLLYMNITNQTSHRVRTHWFKDATYGSKV